MQPRCLHLQRQQGVGQAVEQKLPRLPARSSRNPNCSRSCHCSSCRSSSPRIHRNHNRSHYRSSRSSNRSSRASATTNNCCYRRSMAGVSQAAATAALCQPQMRLLPVLCQRWWPWRAPHPPSHRAQTGRSAGPHWGQPAPPACQLSMQAAGRQAAGRRAAALTAASSPAARRKPPSREPLVPGSSCHCRPRTAAGRCLPRRGWRAWGQAGTAAPPAAGRPAPQQPLRCPAPPVRARTAAAQPANPRPPRASWCPTSAPARRRPRDSPCLTSALLRRCPGDGRALPAAAA